ncbi:MAG: exodeoxyribonuclease VII large subunit [Planctomycetota bacterium]|jgi:exodeoxyribonuclease VII large subunit
MPPEIHVYSVSELQSEVRDLLESDYRSIWVEAEISGHRSYPSGHHYLTLKDENAALSAVIWRSAVARLAVAPEDGLRVRARGTLTIYPQRGNYQMIIDRLDPVGVGELQARFERLRRQLESEGLFDAAHKKGLPAFPRRVAVITSSAGAAVRDVIHVAGRRWPLLELVVVPVRVQGETAASEIAAAIARADRLGFDALVVGRGGGSLEDLWAFNEEIVARAIFAADTPVVSAVGHEVDVSIADLVADLRAATPSAAAEAITPDAREVAGWLDDGRRRLGRALANRVNTLRERLERVAGSRCFRRPYEPIREAEHRLDDVAARLGRGATDALVRADGQLRTTAARLEALSPLRVLARGYSVTLKDEQVVRQTSDVSAGDAIRTILADGDIRSIVENQ